MFNIFSGCIIDKEHWWNVYCELWFGGDMASTLGERFGVPNGLGGFVSDLEEAEEVQ